MGQTVTLKGTKDGYHLIIQTSELTHHVIEDINELLENLIADTNKDSADLTDNKSDSEQIENNDQEQLDNNNKNDETLSDSEDLKSEDTNQLSIHKSVTNHNEKIALMIKTENFLLTKEEEENIIETIEASDLFEVKSIESNTVTKDSVKEWILNHSPQIHTGNVRSGQTIDAPTDLLFIGNVQPGGEIRANRNIFIIGELKGIAHAGADGNKEAVIVADFKHEGQIRIADHVQIIEPTADLAGKFKAALINSQGTFEFQDIKSLDSLRPDITKLMGGAVE